MEVFGWRVFECMDEIYLCFVVYVMCDVCGLFGCFGGLKVVMWFDVYVYDVVFVLLWDLRFIFFYVFDFLVDVFGFEYEDSFMFVID